MRLVTDCWGVWDKFCSGVCDRVEAEDSSRRLKIVVEVDTDKELARVKRLAEYD